MSIDSQAFPLYSLQVLIHSPYVQSQTYTTSSIYGKQLQETEE